MKDRGSGTTTLKAFDDPRIRLGFVLLMGVVTAGWVRPSLPSKATPVDRYQEKLEFVTLTVNGVGKIVRDDGELTVVRGDVVKIESATLKGSDGTVAEVNMVGYKNPGRRAGEDRGYEIQTARDFIPSWSEGGKGQVYAITASTDDRLHGAAFIRIVDPVFKYAELTINGKSTVLRDGEDVVVKATDLVKVEKVVTNIGDLDDVLVQFLERDRPEGAASGRAVEIVFSRAGAVFAKIPIVVQE